MPELESRFDLNSCKECRNECDEELNVKLVTEITRGFTILGFTPNPLPHIALGQCPKELRIELVHKFTKHQKLGLSKDEAYELLCAIEACH